MKIIEKNENKIVFEADIKDVLANAIRRYVNHIPTLAVDEIEISKNDSPLYDEMIANRIGLIPLKADKSGKKEPKIKLNVSKEGMVYSEEMKGEAKPSYDRIPITYLNKEQELELEASTKIGTGIEHSKFSPGMIFYRNVSEISMDKKMKEKIKAMIPNSEIKEKGNKISVLDNGKKEIVDLCESICNEDGEKPEIEIKDELIITVESFGQISPEEIFKKSIEELEKDLSEISKKMEKD
ncbi:DNA-directed RNA polymerase subunit D [Candidatus Pacearchaeota archaeon]|nr:DNA-directed RNA polymerase subunit D [Candidatus Pacearchaeota archaeon]